MDQNKIEDIGIELSIVLDSLNRVYNSLKIDSIKDRKFISVVRCTNRLRRVYDEIRALCEDKSLLTDEYERLSL